MCQNLELEISLSISAISLSKFWKRNPKIQRTNFSEKRTIECVERGVQYSALSSTTYYLYHNFNRPAPHKTYTPLLTFSSTRIISHEAFVDFEGGAV